MAFDREELLEKLAMALVANPGSTMKELADSAGISKASLHRIYSTKEKLQTIIIERIQSGGNAVKIAAAVKTELAKLQETLPAGVQVHLVRDDARRIEESIHSVYEDLILGGIFAVLVVFLFLGDIRSTMISAVTLPRSRARMLMVRKRRIVSAVNIWGRCRIA